MFDKKKDAKSKGIDKPESQEPEVLKAVKVHTIPKEFYDGGLGQGKAHPPEAKKVAVKKPEVKKPQQPKQPVPMVAKKPPENAQLTTTKSGINVWVLVGGVIFFMVLFALVAYVYLVVLKKDSAPEPIVIAPIVETPIIDEPIIEPIIDEPIDEPEIVIPEYPIGLRDYVLAPDTDLDQLSDTEEAEIYKSNPNRPDDDSDGFIDGHEVFHVYDPSKFQPSDLVDSGLVKTSVNTVFGYEVFYPSTWSRDLLDADGTDVLFTSAGGEYIEIIVHPNREDATLSAWYLERAPKVTSSQTKNVATKGGLQGLLSPDGLSMFIARGELVYELRYDIGVRTDAQFMRTFVMMQNSLSFTTDPLYTPEKQESVVPEPEIDLGEPMADEGVDVDASVIDETP